MDPSHSDEITSLVGAYLCFICINSKIYEIQTGLYRYSVLFIIRSNNKSVIERIRELEYNFEGFNLDIIF